MRRNKRRELNIFTMSALDLFASALGAFVLIAVISLPYYLNIDQTDIVKSQKEQINTLKAKTQSLQNRSAQCEIDKEKLGKDIAGAGSQNRAMQATLDSQKSTILKLESQLRNTIKFALLGISTKVESFTIVVDMSGSMKSFKQTVKSTLDRLLVPMVGKCKVQVIGYRGSDGGPKIISWNSGHQLKKLNRSSLSDLKGFIGGMVQKFDGDTPTAKALEIALKDESKAIIILTDGQPTDMKSKKVISHITKLNKGKKEIHTVAIGNYVKKIELSKFLMDLAAKNRGGFIGIASID